MADNTIITAMHGGDVIATDDIGGVKHQRVKIGHGSDGVYSDTSDVAPLPVTVHNTPSVGVVSGSGVGAGRLVITAGSPVQLPDSGVLSVTVRAPASNVGTIFLGGPAVHAGDGFALAPGDAISIDVANLSLIHVDADTTGDAVNYLWVSG